MGNLGPIELTLILVIVVLLFGAKRLPDTAKSVGQSLKIFKKSIKDDEDKSAETREVTATTDTTPPVRVDVRVEDPNRSEN